MEEIIRRFLAVDYYTDYSVGSGDAYGSGDGSGYSDGSGYDDETGDGSGYSDGCGAGSGYGYGSGYSDGYGDDCGNGSCYGAACGAGLSTYNWQKIYVVDTIATLIDSVHGQYAKGSIINSDLTLSPCYIARCGNCFAHGETLEMAKCDAEAKALQYEPIENRIERFKSTYPDMDATVSNAELYKWHNILTGSCEFGRKSFAKEHDIDIDNGSMTVREFIELTKDAFGGGIIKRLKENY